jgi:hypothetical protein
MEKSTDLQTLAVYGIAANKNGPINQTKGIHLYAKTVKAEIKSATQRR